MNVLLTAGSRRVALLQAFQAAVRARSSGRVIVTDVDATSPTVHLADRAYRVPLSSDAGYTQALVEICAAEKIGLVVPTIDDELEVLAAARSQFEQLGAMLACSSSETAALCNDKYETCMHLSRHGVAAAASWLPSNLPADAFEALFIKPRVGRGGVSAFVIRTRRELEFFLEYVKDPVIQEYLHSPEYTIDVMCDGRGVPVSIVPRERTLIRAGVIDRGRTVSSPALEALAVRVTEAIPFRGAINIQCRMRGDVPVVIEINPRFSGGIGLTIASGADFADMLVRQARGETIAPAIGQFRADLWMTSYESAIFLPASRLALKALGESTAPLQGAA
jgi:carbamoyl-phosphate synthase large subunit